MSDEVKLCGECAALTLVHNEFGAVLRFRCDSHLSLYGKPEDARRDKDDCGPSGKYWEPKK